MTSLSSKYSTMRTKHLNHLTLYTLIAFLMILSCFSCRRGDREVHTLRILHTTDVHGNILGYDFIKDQYTPDGLGRVATYVARVRMDYPYSLMAAMYYKVVQQYITLTL